MVQPHRSRQCASMYSLPSCFELHGDVGKLSGERVTSSEPVMMKNKLKLIKFR